MDVITENNKQINLYESYKKAKALPHDIPVYFYSGHGTDICNEDGTPVIKVVPDNCIYITLTTCGKLLSALQIQILEKFHTKDTSMTEILRTPYIPGHKKKIADFFGQKEEDVHIHYPGMTYIENLFYPLNVHTHKYATFMQSSGLLEKSQFENEDLILLLSVFADKDYKYYNIIRDLSLDGKYLYREYYTKNDVFELVDEYYADRDWNVKSKYYKDRDLNVKSKEQLKQKAYEMVEELFRQENVQHRDDVNLLMLKIRSNEIYNKSDFPTLYKSSVYPKEEFINSLLNWLQLDYDILSEDNLGYLGAETEQENSYLMDKFPGIHIAHICRNVQPTCQEQANVRRVMSKQQENMRESMNINEQRIGFYDLLGKIRKNIKQVNTILKENKELIDGFNNSSRKQLFKYIMSHSPSMNASRKNNIMKKLALPNNDTSQKGGSRKSRKTRKNIK